MFRQTCSCKGCKTSRRPKRSHGSTGDWGQRSKTLAKRSRISPSFRESTCLCLPYSGKRRSRDLWNSQWLLLLLCRSLHCWAPRIYPWQSGNFWMEAISWWEFPMMALSSWFLRSQTRFIHLLTYWWQSGKERSRVWEFPMMILFTMLISVSRTIYHSQAKELSLGISNNDFDLFCLLGPCPHHWNYLARQASSPSLLFTICTSILVVNLGWQFSGIHIILYIYQISGFWIFKNNTQIFYEKQNKTFSLIYMNATLWLQGENFIFQENIIVK